MKRLLLLPAILLGFAASATAEPITIVHTTTIVGHAASHVRYWWTAADNCTLTIDQTHTGQLLGTPYVVCVSTPAGWHSTPQHLGPASNSAAPYGPCGYEGNLCRTKYWNP